MTLDEYKVDYSGAAWPLEDFAYEAEKIEDNAKLSEAAKQFIIAQVAFENALDNAGIELG